MLKHSFIEILKTFSNEDLVKFRDFVSSPYHNKISNIVKLFDQLKKYSPEFNDKNLSDESIWEKLFPGKDYHYGNMKNLLHEFSKLCEKYIRLEYYEESELHRDFELLDSLAERNITKLYLKKFSSFKKKYTSDYLGQLNVNITNKCNVMAGAHLVNGNVNFNSNPNYINDDFTLACEYSVYSFILFAFSAYNDYKALKIKDWFSDVSIINILIHNLGDSGIRNILNYYKDNSKLDYDILNTYYLMYQSLLDDSNVEKYRKFKNSVTSTAFKFSFMDLRNLYISLLNIAPKITSPDFQYVDEQHEIHDLMIRDRVFAVFNGQVSELFFIKYVVQSQNDCSSEKLNKFISAFTKKLPFEKQEYCHNFAMACVNFINSDFRKSIEYISKVNGGYFDIKIYIRNLQLKNYYELNMEDPLLFTLDSARHFVTSNKSISNSAKKNIISCYNFISKIFRIRKNFDFIKFNQIKEEVNKSVVYEKTWLLKKLDELEIKHKKPSQSANPANML